MHGRPGIRKGSLAMSMLKPDAPWEYQSPMRYLIMSGAILLAAAGCATSGSVKVTPDGSGGAFPKVALRQEADTLGNTVRRVGEEAGGGLVLMSGLEEVRLESMRMNRTAYAGLVQRLCEKTGLLSEAEPAYFFLYPPGYEALLAQDTAAQLPARYGALTADVSFGAGTALFNVFAVLSQLLDVTIVADNVIAEVRCGEFFLRQAPLSAILDAALKSARLVPEAIVIEATDECIFVRGAENAAAVAGPINEAALSDEERALLDRRVSACLPKTPEQPGQSIVLRGAVELKKALDTMSAQFGVTVTADASDRVQLLPVNLTVLNDVTLRTAMALLIRQWPLARFGYEVRSGSLHILEVAP